MVATFQELIQLLSTSKHTKEEAIAWVKELKASVGKSTVCELTAPKLGDVIFHSFLNHPMVLLKQDHENSRWFGIMLTTDPFNSFEKVESRFTNLSTSHYTTSIVGIHYTAMGKFMGTVNVKHVIQVYKKLKAIILNHTDTEQ